MRSSASISRWRGAWRSEVQPGERLELATLEVEHDQVDARESRVGEYRGKRPRGNRDRVGLSAGDRKPAGRVGAVGADRGHQIAELDLDGLVR